MIEDIATSMVSRFGTDVTLRQTSAGTYSTTTRSYSGESTTETTIRAAIIPRERDQSGGSIVVSGEMVAYLDPAALSAASLTPAVGDFIEYSGTRYRIEELRSMPLEGTQVYLEASLLGTE